MPGGTLEKTHPTPTHNVNFVEPRSFKKVLKSSLAETFFPDDPFNGFKKERPKKKFFKGLQYFVPIFEWLPNYNLKLFRYDILAGITIASLAIPQGISYADLTKLPPVVGLYSSFVPPLIYAILGSSKNLAVGTTAACSLLIAQTIGEKVSPTLNPSLYIQLVFTATFIAGLLETVLGFLRLGILVDLLSHSAITGFMGGTAVLICLQQLKGILGLSHFTSKTDLISVMKAVFSNRNEWHWQSAVVGIIFLAFLQFARYLVLAEWEEGRMLQKEMDQMKALQCLGWSMTLLKRGDMAQAALSPLTVINPSRKGSEETLTQLAVAVMTAQQSKRTVQP